MKELTIVGNRVIIDGIDRKVSLALASGIDAVQWHSSTGKCLEEPNFTEVNLSKYQDFIDEHQAIIAAEENYSPSTEQIAQEKESARLMAYQQESDPLFFKFQRGEATKEEWLSKVEEIKSRYP